MKYPTSRNGISLLNAFLSGHRLTVLTCLQYTCVAALSQEVGRLKKLGWPVESKMIDLPSGKRIKQYWIAAGRNIGLAGAPFGSEAAAFAATPCTKHDYQRVRG